MSLEYTTENTKNFDYALLFGGKGYEKDVSLAGAYRFLKEAERIGLNLLPIFIDSAGEFYVFRGKARDVSNINRDASYSLISPVFPMRIGDRVGFLKADGELIDVKLVFPLLHGDFGEDGVIQGLLTSLGIEFVGADNFTGAVATDKVFSKIIASSIGVPTLPHIAIAKGDADVEAITEKIEKDFGFPVFVKPARLGSSIGASITKSKQMFAQSLEKAFSVSDRIMIEPALTEKRELECAYYNIGEKRIITPPAEIAVDGGFYDYDSKYRDLGGVRLVPRADIGCELRDKIISYTDALARALCIRHIARFDYFLSDDGNVYFNEVNTMPGMTETSLYSSMLKLAGVDFSEFLRSIKEICT